MVTTMYGGWNLWVKLNRVGRVGIFIALLGLCMLSQGGESSDDRFAIIGGGIFLAGVVMMVLNRRDGDDD
jgi:drug/metabolite transporter (DMT)-like permease